MKSKTMIISSPNNSSSGRGILTLYMEDDLLKSKLRLYNMQSLSKYCKLAIYHEKEVSQANMLEKFGVYESSFVGNFDIDKDFYCAIIDTENQNNVMLAGGTYSGFYFNDTSVFSSTETNSLETSIECETCSDEDRCKNCKYKEYFYSSQNAEIIKPESTTTNTDSNNILTSILPQFQYVFDNYPPNDELITLLPNSKFVKINENEDEYSIGAIYEDDNMKLICYAIKCNYNQQPPQELGEHYQWLPLDKEDPLSEGYYIVFQDAKDLKILKL